MKTVLVAPDSFKGSLSAREAARAIAQGLPPGLTILECPLSDGGEGFLSIAAKTKGDLYWVDTTDALDRPRRAPFLRWDDTVLVELATVAGLLPERDPLRATTFGVGTLIQQAWDQAPFQELILSLGGSATVDGGAGLLQALGIRLLDRQGDPIPRGGAGLASLHAVSTEGRSPVFRARITLAVDVENPLLGPRGAAQVFGPQKGAKAEDLPLLEECLARLARCFGVDPQTPGLGAAGGVPVGLVALGAEMESGFEWLARWIDLPRLLDRADLVITGEGRLDQTSFEGKVVGRLHARCRERGLPLLVLAGSADPDMSLPDGVFLLPSDLPLSERIARAEELLTECAKALPPVLFA